MRVCVGTDVFCFLVCGSPALETPPLEAVTLRLCACVWQIAKGNSYGECDVFSLVGFAFGVQQLHPALIQRPFG